MPSPRTHASCRSPSISPARRRSRPRSLTAPDVTLLVNNAGIAAQWGGGFTDPGWLTAGREAFEVNVLGTFTVTQAFAPVLAADGGGAVANVSSVVGLVSFPQAPWYSLLERRRCTR